MCVGLSVKRWTEYVYTFHPAESVLYDGWSFNSRSSELGSMVKLYPVQYGKAAYPVQYGNVVSRARGFLSLILHFVCSLRLGKWSLKCHQVIRIAHTTRETPGIFPI